MYQGKTKRGVDLKSTRSIRISRPTTTWLLIMDSSQARLYQETPKKNKKIELLREWKNPEARKKSSDLVSDRPGRSFESYTKAHRGQTGRVRHGLSSRRTPQENSTIGFVTRLASAIGDCKRKKVFENLVLVAEPRLLGEIRKRLDSETRKAVVAEIEKDFSWVSGNAMERRIRGFSLH